ncbi:hypothetical protein PL8927_480026 [Planktothrix serta PCC 8927]|jgi:hypothetical protein|uniref:Uncharacterized protein n=1 Tax=Planktothrix serta PCC 8927 TaxID=671068 RepID=A0A7Z9BJI9_9CYAN|nr:hypothetical protein PL8927_480026 [Planktothrix serta PCC 8927]
MQWHRASGLGTDAQGESLTVQHLTLNEYGGTRTPDPQDRNLMLYPLSYIPTLLIV